MEYIHRQTLLQLAREALESSFGMKDSPLYERLKREEKEPYTYEVGCFVTLHNKKSGNLCGCIGNLWGKGPLLEEIPKLARAAAFNDPRFYPLKQEELVSIVIQLSLLSRMQSIDEYQNIRLGIDGVLLTHGYHRAVFLPQVATEQGWDLETMLTQLCRKAGLDQNAYRDEACRFEVFQAQVFGEENETFL